MNASGHGAWRRRGSVLAAAVLVFLAACGTSTSPTPGGGASGGGLAERWRDAMSPKAIGADLATLQEIADRHGGNRAAGTGGYDASAAFVAQALRELGYRVTLDTFSLPLFSEVGSGVLTVPGAPPFEVGRDFRAMLFSGSGDLETRIVAVGYDRDADPVAFLEHPNGRGCNAGDYPPSARGAVVLLLPGGCYRRSQAESAQAAGAAAIVVAYPQWEPDGVLRPTLLRPDGITIPVIGATREVGAALADAADAGASVRLRMQTAIVDRSVSSVIADTPGGDASQVIMVGGHLDSALEGPGINDDGSGTMTVLEMARRLASLGPPHQRVRFAFWAGEELGLYGSRHYVEGLSDSDRSAIEVYLNFDMLGSSNGGRLVYADAGDPSGSESVTRLFTDYFDAAGLTHGELDLSGASDHYSFAQAGIPTGGLFSGANEMKTSVDAQTFGGTPDALYDACYHRACDRQDKLDLDLLEQMARAAAYVTGELASGSARLAD